MPFCFPALTKGWKEGLTDRWCDSLSTVANSDPQFLLILGEDEQPVGAALPGSLASIEQQVINGPSQLAAIDPGAHLLKVAHEDANVATLRMPADRMHRVFNECSDGFVVSVRP